MLYEGNNIMTVKRSNRSAVLTILHRNGAMSRKRLAEITKLTPAAITKITSELIEEHLVYEGSSLSVGSVGRREVLINMNPTVRCALGIHINIGMAILSGVWMDGALIFEERCPLPVNAPAEETIEMLSMRLMELLHQHMIDRELVIGVGIASRGINSADFRYITNSYRAFDSMNIPVAELVEKYTGFHAIVENNVRALLNAHMYLAKDGHISSKFFLRCEYGIGGAVWINNAIWQGSSGQCSEIGHIPVVRRNGRQCSCGKRGCLETVASPASIINDAKLAIDSETTPVLYHRAQKIGEDALTIDDIFTAASCGDEPIRKIVQAAVMYLASALKAIMYSMDPHEIILYGRMFENDYFLAKFNSEMQDNIDAYHRIPIRKSEFGHKLEPRAAGLLMVTDFIEKGGIE